MNCGYVPGKWPAQENIPFIQDKNEYDTFYKVTQKKTSTINSARSQSDSLDDNFKLPRIVLQPTTPKSDGDIKLPRIVSATANRLDVIKYDENFLFRELKYGLIVKLHDDHVICVGAHDEQTNTIRETLTEEEKNYCRKICISF